MCNGNNQMQSLDENQVHTKATFLPIGETLLFMYRTHGKIRTDIPGIGYLVSKCENFI